MLIDAVVMCSVYACLPVPTFLPAVKEVMHSSPSFYCYIHSLLQVICCSVT